MLSNREISRLFNLYAELLLLHEGSEKKAHVFSGAAYRLKNMDTPVLTLSKTDLSKSFRSEIIKSLVELNKNESLQELENLIQLTPAGLFEMMRIKGLGGKKLSLIWKKAKIDTIDGLLAACKEDKLFAIPGFGKKTETNIISAIESYNDRQSMFHYATIAEEAELLIEYLKKIFKNSLVSLCSDARRHSVVLSGIDIVTTLTANTLSGKNLNKYLVIQTSRKDITTAHTLSEIPVRIYHVPKPKYFYRLFELTGSAEHVQTVLNKIKTNKEILESLASEADIYQKANLPFIIPELRENLAEWQFAKSKSALVQTGDIKGVVHNHTDWSDGVDCLDDFVNACKVKNFEYVVISDHSKNAHYAGGLKEEKVLRQLAAIGKLNIKLSPFKIFKSIECDILVSGDLDYDAALLQKFDMVIISIHQQLKMTEEKATARLIKAIENPYTTILGHMTGRQLLIRPGYPANIKKVIDACAANGVVIEINANPYRLDMDWSHIPYALKKGVMISINPDAHSISEIDNIRWGISAARKGGLTTAMTWNALPLSKIEAWLKHKRAN